MQELTHLALQALLAIGWTAYVMALVKRRLRADARKSGA
jgi:hypothetical protein